MEKRWQIHRGGRAVAGLILVFLGLLFLVGNISDLEGALFLGVLGAAFVIARFWTGRYGLVIPGCILLGLGVFVGLEERRLVGVNPGALFFVTLGLSFVLVYILGARWQAYWSLVVGILLAFLGVVALARLDLMILQPEIRAALATWWPAAIVLLGAWLLLRDSIPGPIRRALGAVIIILVVAAVILGMVAVSYGIGGAAITRPNEVAETVSLSSGIEPGGQLVVVNSSGATKVRGGDAGEVSVLATKRAWALTQEEARRALDLTQVEVIKDGARVEITTEGERPAPSFFGPQGWMSVDYEVIVPDGTTLELTAGSGKILVQDYAGNVQVEGSSGEVVLQRVEGDVRVSTSSGDIELTDVSGQVSARAISGDIRATRVNGPRELASTSGRINFEGLVQTDARLETSSGDVRVVPTVGSAFTLNATSRSGRIRSDLALAKEVRDKDRLEGVFNNGDARLEIRTSSGDIRIQQ